MSDSRKPVGPQVGDFLTSPEIREDEPQGTLPSQDEFFRPPIRFGSVPVEEKPLGYDSRRGYKKLFPPLMLPTQVVERVTFGHPEFQPNRLFWGDNLHVMRSLPGQTIDLIYIDPPFFSGRNYNVIFGDKNELRSFSDIWEGGMPGYLIWLNARLVEMKRLLKPTGSIYVHCDWHASHYIKVELDKIFGYESFVNEIAWCYKSGGASKNRFSRKHDVLLFYARSADYKFNFQKEKSYGQTGGGQGGKVQYFRDEFGTYSWAGIKDWWDISMLSTTHPERIGYPTQKPEALLRRVIEASSNPNEIVADFFIGGGTTASVAQSLGRRWIACDQSRVAVAITADRLAKAAEQPTLEGTTHAVPDFTIEHWGIYERGRLSTTPAEGFREFVLRAFNATPCTDEPGIHGTKGSVPVWVGQPDQKSQVTGEQVVEFANAVKRTPRYQQDNLRDGIMLAWAFRPDALTAAEQLRAKESTDLNFVRIEQIRIDSPRFREHIAALSTDHADYANFLTFVQPPRVELGWKRTVGRTFLFDVSETIVLNPGANIINVQWDFDYGQRFTSSQGYSFVRGAKGAPAQQVEYTFPANGRYRIAVKVQDDLGGEGMSTGDLDV